MGHYLSLLKSSIPRPSHTPSPVDKTPGGTRNAFGKAHDRQESADGAHREATAQEQTASTGKVSAFFRDPDAPPRPRRKLEDLPEEIVLYMMKYLDEASVFLLSQTSRLFFRISYDVTLPHRRSSSILSSHSRYVVWEHLRRDLYLYCRSCADFRINNRDAFFAKLRALNRPLFCSACNDEHRRFRFSPRQRQLPQTERICIGREGRLKIQNWPLSWDEFDAWRRAANASGRWVTHLNPPLFGKARLTPTGARTWHKAILFRAPLHERQTFATLAELCRRSPNKEMANSICCPHVQLDDPSLLSAFAPKNCACLEFGEHQHKKHSKSQHTMGQDMCCKCKALQDPSRAGRFLHVDGDQLQDSEHCYLCEVCMSFYTWRGEGELIVLTCLRNIKFLHPTRSEWLQQIDPMSYSITSDEESKHVMWCPDESCYLRRRWRGITGPTMDRLMFESSL